MGQRRKLVVLLLDKAMRLIAGSKGKSSFRLRFWTAGPRIALILRRRSRIPKRHSESLIALLFIAGLAVSFRYIIALLIIALLIYSFYRYIDFRSRQEGLRLLELYQVDQMTGREFEYFIAQLMANLGYKTEVTKHSYDKGVDVIARQGRRQIAVQVKCYKRPVDGRAVSAVVTGMPHYHCNECMVVTNNHFTAAAVHLAAPHRCTLVDRDGLVKWMLQIANKS